MSFSRSFLLPFEDVADFRFEFKALSTISLSGRAMHSSYVTGAPIQKRVGAVLAIDIPLLSDNSDGNRRADFSVEIQVPEDVDTVIFGPTKKAIWTRARVREC